VTFFYNGLFLIDYFCFYFNCFFNANSIASNKPLAFLEKQRRILICVLRRYIKKLILEILFFKFVYSSYEKFKVCFYKCKFSNFLEFLTYWRCWFWAGYSRNVVTIFHRKREDMFEHNNIIEKFLRLYNTRFRNSCVEFIRR
jgi:hypothetical protein